MLCVPVCAVKTLWGDVMTAEEVNRADKVESITTELETLMDLICYFVAEGCGQDKMAVGLRLLSEHIVKEIKTLR